MTDIQNAEFRPNSRVLTAQYDVTKLIPFTAVVKPSLDKHK